MKRYVLEVVIEEGYDEFWESNPAVEEVEELVARDLFTWDPVSVKVTKYEEWRKPFA